MAENPDDDILRMIRRDRERGELRELDFYLSLGSDLDGATIAAVYDSGDDLQGTIASDRRDRHHADDDLATLGLPASSPDDQLRTIGPYRLIRELGRGGQGFVHLAEDGRLGRKVALKLLSGLAAGSRQGLLRFRREAEAASRLDDPGICTVYETGEIDGLPFIAMQYVEGESLAARIRARSRGEASRSTDPDGTPDSSSARGDLDDWGLVIERVARSLHAAHEAGLVHRDVKPANIMISRDGRPVILDFGLARADDHESQGLTRTGDLLGTPAYMAPEQILGRVHEIDRRSDVYALGVTLFECLAGQRPHSAPTREALYRQSVEGAPPPPSRFDPRVPRDLDVIVLTALDREPDRRYQSALALADDLRRFRHREPIAARPAGPLLRLGRWAERNPALATALGLLFLFLSVGLGVTTSLWQRSETSLAEAREAKKLADRKTREARANLRDYELLSDLQRFEDYVEEIELLFPPDPARLPAIEDWLGRVRELCAQRPALEERLASLRRQSRDLDLEEIVGRRPDTNVDALVDLDRRLELLVAERETARGDGDAEGVAELDRLRDRLVDRRNFVARAVIDGNRHHFDDVAQQWKHLNLERLIRSIEVLEIGAPSPMTEVLFLREQSEKVGALSLEGAAAEAWSEAIARIAATDSPYGGLRIEPQLGLLPLGPDPESGLEEFAQVLTGSVPRRDASGDLIRRPGFAAVFVLLPGADFEITFDTADLPQENPGPRRVRLDPFFISKYEFSIAQWEAGTGDILRNAVGENDVSQAEYDRTGDSPLNNVAWEIAQRYMQRLGMQLPTEAQWEYAARAGAAGSWPIAGDPDSLVPFANIGSDGAGPDRFSAIAPVGSFAANGFGLHDVLGNVWELTRDGLDVDSVPLMPGDGLHGFGDQDAYVIRGGGYRNEASLVRFDIRASIDRSSSTSSVGIRPIRILQGSADR